MFGNGTLPECADITVDFHTYRVVVRYADSGELVHRVDTVAGSVAQAAMLVGMELLARLLVKEHTVEETEIFVHNLTNHVNVEVTLIG